MQQTNLPGAKKPEWAISLEQDGKFFEKSTMFIKHCAILLDQTSNIFDPFEMSVESSPHRRKRFCGISILFQQEQTERGLLKAEKDFVNILINFSNLMSVVNVYQIHYLQYAAFVLDC